MSENYLLIRVMEKNEDSVEKSLWKQKDAVLALPVLDGAKHSQQRCRKRFEKRLLRELKRLDLLEAVKTGEVTLIFQDKVRSLLELPKEPYPAKLVEEWLGTIPKLDTVIFLDNEFMQVRDYFMTTTGQAAAIIIFCTKEALPEYESMVEAFFMEEGIVLQIFSYESNSCSALIKGQAGILDFSMENHGAYRKVCKLLPEGAKRFSLEDYIWK